MRVARLAESSFYLARRETSRTLRKIDYSDFCSSNSNQPRIIDFYEDETMQVRVASETFREFRNGYDFLTSSNQIAFIDCYTDTGSLQYSWIFILFIISRIITRDAFKKAEDIGGFERDKSHGWWWWRWIQSSGF